MSQLLFETLKCFPQNFAPTLLEMHVILIPNLLSSTF